LFLIRWALSFSERPFLPRYAIRKADVRLPLPAANKTPGTAATSKASMLAIGKSDDLTFFSGGNVTAGWQPTLDRYRQHYQSRDRKWANWNSVTLRN